ncbi:monocarboxylate transporter 12-like [Antedon mediterranea]|uniref:monocarboxylate transporter 12-like n=1 Tax=Antedon mediterranea TaxID=105859 RepID=UPI003AF50BF5
MKVEGQEKYGSSSKNLDGGWGWIVVMGAFFNMILIVGFMNGSGIYLANWKNDLGQSTSIVAGAISLFPTIVLMTNFLASYLSRRYGERIVMFFGGLIASAGCILASFSTQIYHLYLSFSLLTGIGYGLAFQPTVVMPIYYFKKRYAVANGLVFSGAGVGMVVLPLLLRVLIDNYTWRGTFLILGGVSLNMSVVARLMRPLKLKDKNEIEKDEEINERGDNKKYDSKIKDEAEDISLSLMSVEQKKENFEYKKTNYSSLLKGYIKKSTFWYVFTDSCCILVVMVKVFMAFGSLPVVVHFPYMATVSGITEKKTALLMSILGMASLFSRICHGFFVDKFFSVNTLMTFALFLGGIIALLCPVSNSFSWLLVVAILFGLANGIYNPLIVPFERECVGNQMLSATLGITFPLLGIAATIAGIFSGWLYDYTNNYDVSFYFAGSTHICASIIVQCLDRISVKKRRQNSIKMGQLDVESIF